MKIRSFKEHLEKRLDKDEIAEIEAAARLELESLRALQQDISKALIEHMAEQELGFNDIVRQLGKSPSQVSKIIKGEANLTLASVAQLFALMNKRPQITGYISGREQQ